VIPGTLLGALFLAACLVPGFVFLRVAEVRRGHLARSSLVEAVELAGVGAATSLIAAMVVLGIGRWWSVIKASSLARDPGTYLLLHPFRGLGSVLATFSLSCVLAWIAARAVFKSQESVFHPAGTSWAKVMWEDLPSASHRVLVTVELKDGRRVVGVVRSFTAELAANRELALTPPIGAQFAAGKELIQIDDDFILLREEQIVSIAGRYVPRPPARSSPAAADTRDAVPAADG
jgi:hypothetical protein